MIVKINPTRNCTANPGKGEIKAPYNVSLINLIPAPAINAGISIMIKAIMRAICKPPSQLLQFYNVKIVCQERTNSCQYFYKFCHNHYINNIIFETTEKSEYWEKYAS